MNRRRDVVAARGPGPGERLASAVFGALFGSVYGLLLAVGAAWFTDGHFRVDWVWHTMGIFAALGLVLGTRIGDVLGLLLHFVFGLLAGIFAGDFSARIGTDHSGLRALFALGFGTGVALVLTWQTG